MSGESRRGSLHACDHNDHEKQSLKVWKLEKMEGDELSSGERND